MMVEAAPSAPFVIAEPDLLLELLIIAFDTPAQPARLESRRIPKGL
jgi:hypothetical protein